MNKFTNIAENYTADAKYEVGTVLDFGGTAEVTLSTGKALPKLAGVVADVGSLVLDNNCEGEFVTPVVLQGKAMVRAIGMIQRGDLLVSYGNGIAKRTNEAHPGTIIGKALESHAGDESLIKVAIGRC